MADNLNDTRTPEDVLKAQRMMITIFGFATLMPALWMLMMGWSAFNSTGAAPTGNEDFHSIVIYWGLAAPVVWLVSNGLALKKIKAGKGDDAKLYPLIPAFWAILWFASQVAG